MQACNYVLNNNAKLQVLHNNGLILTLLFNKFSFYYFTLKLWSIQPELFHG